MNFFWEKVYTTFIFYFIFTVRCLWENWCYNLWQNILCFWKSWTQIQNRDKQIYKKHKNQIKMLNIIKFICKPLFKLNYSCLYFNKGLEKHHDEKIFHDVIKKYFNKKMSSLFILNMDFINPTKDDQILFEMHILISKCTLSSAFLWMKQLYKVL